MGAMFYFTVIAFIVQSSIHIFVAHIHKNQWLANIKEREVEWDKERKDLLDRVMSPTFAEYKQQEVKVIKAKNGTDKPDVVIEQL